MQRQFPRLRITGPQDCAVAQGARLALVLRGWPPGPAGQAQATRLLVERQPGVILTIEDPAAMIELIEDLHPDQPLHPRDPATRARHRGLIALAGPARGELGRVTGARNLRDLDIAVFALRDTLARLDRGLAGEPLGPLANLDLSLAPLLWRIAILDRRFGLHLGDGLAACRGRIAQAFDHPQVRLVLDRAAGRRFLDGIDPRSALHDTARAGAEWRRAFADRRARVLPFAPSGRAAAARPARAGLGG